MIETVLRTVRDKVFVEKCLGDLVLRREITINDIYALAQPTLPQSMELRREFLDWSQWADSQFLEAKLTDL